jgi:hypothetical protein
MDRSKLGQQRRQAVFDRGWGQRRDVGARSLDLRDGAPFSAQPSAAAGTSDVDA